MVAIVRRKSNARRLSKGSWYLPKNKKDLALAVIGAVGGPSAAAAAKMAMDWAPNAPASGKGMHSKRKRSVSTSSVKRNLFGDFVAAAKSGGNVVKNFKRVSFGNATRSKFPRPKKNKVDAYSRYGVVYKYENGGNVSTTGKTSAIIGHSTSCPETQFTLVCACLIKELMQQAGQAIQSWDDVCVVPTTTCRIEVDYYTTASATSRQYIDVNPSGVTYWNLATLLQSGFQGAISDTQQETPEWQRAVLKDIAGTGTVYSTVLLNQFIIDFHTRSDLDLQNVTLAATPAAGNDDDLMTDITNNPLIGKQYFTSNSNGFFPKWRPNNDASYVPFISDSTYGIFTNKSVDSIPEVLSEPPKPEFWYKCKKSLGVKVNPGQIKYSTVYHKKSLSFGTFMSKFRYYATTSGVTKDRFDFGNTKMYILEKALDNRAETSPISIDWEINCTFKAKYRYKPVVYTAEKQTVL